MSSRTSQILIGITPDGTEVSMRTSGGYDTAGIVRNSEGNWSIVAKGTSSESVRSRTSAYFGRSTTAVSWKVIPLMEDIPQPLKDYFPGEQMFSLRVRQVRREGGLWMNARELGLATRPSKRAIRQLRKAGYTDVGVGLGNRVADFTVAELTKIDRRPALGGSLIGSRTR
jgi:hypothetical protein